MIYKIVDPHNYLLMTIEGQLMRRLFEHKRLKPATIPMDRGNVKTLLELKKSYESGNNNQSCFALNSKGNCFTFLQKKTFVNTTHNLISS